MRLANQANPTDADHNIPRVTNRHGQACAQGSVSQPRPETATMLCGGTPRRWQVLGSATTRRPKAKVPLIDLRLTTIEASRSQSALFADDTFTRQYLSTRVSAPIRRKEERHPVSHVNSPRPINLQISAYSLMPGRRVGVTAYRWRG
jgi:hypothetical protein